MPAASSYRFWIDMALECNRRDHTNNLSIGDQTGPFLSARALGLALAALHDASAFASSQTPLLMVPASPGLAGSDPVVAGAAACVEVLLRRYPKQFRFLEPAWRSWAEWYGPAASGPVEQAGRTFGAAVEALGNTDQQNGAPGKYMPNGLPYEHALAPNDPTQSFAGGDWGKATPLLTVCPPLEPPPGRSGAGTVTPSQHYRDDFAKVATKGGLLGHIGTRTLEEEVAGIFWGYDGPPELGTPPRLYMQVVLGILDTLESTSPGSVNVSEALRVVGAIAIALADAGIAAWYYKYAPSHMMWRPVVGISNADPQNGTPMPGWLPLGRPDTNGTGIALTPNFPAYPSGHATFAAAAFQLFRLFLVHKGAATFDAGGVDDVRFSFVSDEYNGRNSDPRTGAPRATMTRSFDSLWSAIVENSLSRLYLGVHWQFDGITTRNVAGNADEFGVPGAPSRLGHTGGVWLGAQIANQIAAKLGIPAPVIAASGVA